jgi:hypothetical protein
MLYEPTYGSHVSRVSVDDVFKFFFIIRGRRFLEELETASEAHAPKINKIIFSFTPFFYIFIYFLFFTEQSLNYSILFNSSKFHI